MCVYVCARICTRYTAVSPYNQVHTEFTAPVWAWFQCLLWQPATLIQRRGLDTFNQTQAQNVSGMFCTERTWTKRHIRGQLCLLFSFSTSVDGRQLTLTRVGPKHRLVPLKLRRADSRGTKKYINENWKNMTIIVQRFTHHSPDELWDLLAKRKIYLRTEN